MARAREPRLYLRQWSSCSGQLCQELHFSGELDCRLLEYRNLTLLGLVQPFILQGQAAASRCPRQRLLDGNVFVDPVFVNVSQYAIHTLDTALQAWKQVSAPPPTLPPSPVSTAAPTYAMKICDT